MGFSPWINKAGRGDISLILLRIGMFMNDSGVVWVKALPELTARGWCRGVM